MNVINILSNSSIKETTGKPQYLRYTVCVKTVNKQLKNNKGT